MKIIENPPKRPRLFFDYLGIKGSKQSKFPPPTSSVPRPPTRIFSTARIFPFVSLGFAPPTAPPLRRTRSSANLRCSHPFPCAAEAPSSLGWTRRRGWRRNSWRRLAPVRSLPPLGRRMEALPCICTAVRRSALPSASSTRPVRLVGGGLEGGVAPHPLPASVLSEDGGASLASVQQRR